jgi:hypothetical protein
VSEADLAEHQRRTIIGGVRGLVGGLAVALPTAFYANRRSMHFRSLTPALKAFAVVTLVVPTTVISAERAGLEFEKEHWAGVGKEELDLIQQREREHWDSLSTGDKIRDFATRHQYGVIGGAWATTLVGSFAYIMREPCVNPLKTFLSHTEYRNLHIGRNLSRKRSSKPVCGPKG